MGPGVPLFRMQPGESVAKLPNRPIIRLACFSPSSPPVFDTLLHDRDRDRSTERFIRRGVRRFGIFFLFFLEDRRRFSQGFLNGGEIQLVEERFLGIRSREKEF